MSSGTGAALRHTRAVGLTIFGGGDGGSGSRGGGNIHSPLHEYNIPVHRNYSDTGTVSGKRAADKNACGTKMVEVERYQPGVSEGFGKGNGGEIG